MNETHIRLAGIAAGVAADSHPRMTVRRAVDAIAERLVAVTAYPGQVCRRAASLIVCLDLSTARAVAVALEQNSMPLSWWRVQPSQALVAVLEKEFGGGR